MAKFRKVRDGGYSALPAAIRREVEARLVYDEDGNPLGISGTLTKLDFLYLLCMFVGFAVFAYLPYKIVSGVHNAALQDEHVATFSGSLYAVGAVIGIFTAIIWAAYLTYWICARLPNADERAAKIILAVQHNTTRNSTANRKMQNFFLDRVDETDPRLFFEEMWRVFLRMMAYISLPFIFLTAAFTYLDTQAYQYLSPFHLKSSGYFDTRSTLTTFEHISHIEAGCTRKRVKRKNKKAYIRTDLRYEVFFDNGLSIDLYQAEQTGSRIYDIERYDYIFSQFGKQVHSVHDVGRTDTAISAMPELCRQAVRRKMKDKFEARIMAMLRVEEPAEQLSTSIP